MVKWCPSWLNKTDHHGIFLKEWYRFNTSTTAMCRYDGSVINFCTQCFHALKQHSLTKVHTDVHNAKSDDRNTKLAVFEPSPTPSSSQVPHFNPVKLGLALPV